MPLLYDRIKQSMTSAQQTASFLKKRSVIEEEYARAMSKLARSSAESYASAEGKAGCVRPRRLHLRASSHQLPRTAPLSPHGRA
jgi:hypothetical protein